MKNKELLELRNYLEKNIKKIEDNVISGYYVSFEYKGKKYHINTSRPFINIDKCIISEYDEDACNGWDKIHPKCSIDMYEKSFIDCIIEFFENLEKTEYKKKRGIK